MNKILYSTFNMAWRFRINALAPRAPRQRARPTIQIRRALKNPFRKG
jgi:hypothetical protein